jgi:ssDNA-binding Zn-finger/Zn-ribbon topoisomerase 1
MIVCYSDLETNIYHGKLCHRTACGYRQYMGEEEKTKIYTDRKECVTCPKCMANLGIATTPLKGIDFREKINFRTLAETIVALSAHHEPEARGHGSFYPGGFFCKSCGSRLTLSEKKEHIIHSRTCVVLWAVEYIEMQKGE